jgi:hypothetical protein
MVTMRLSAFRDLRFAHAPRKLTTVTPFGLTTDPRVWVDRFLSQMAGSPRPPLVDEKTWRAATGGEKSADVIAALAKANRMSPGCVYLDRRTASTIAYLTALSTFEGDAGRNAVKSLDRICVPRRQANFKKRKLLGSELLIAPLMYCQVLTVRSFVRHFRRENRAGQRRSVVSALAEVRKVFPDLAEVNEKVLARICGFGEESTPLDAVAAALNEPTGYHRTYLKRVLRQSGYRSDRSRNYGEANAKKIIGAYESDLLGSRLEASRRRTELIWSVREAAGASVDAGKKPKKRVRRRSKTPDLVADDLEHPWLGHYQGAGQAHA